LKALGEQATIIFYVFTFDTWTWKQQAARWELFSHAKHQHQCIDNTTSRFLSWKSGQAEPNGSEGSRADVPMQVRCVSAMIVLVLPRIPIDQFLSLSLSLLLPLPFLQRNPLHRPMSHMLPHVVVEFQTRFAYPPETNGGCWAYYVCGETLCVHSRVGEICVKRGRCKRARDALST
jgi:hypothetical protein